MLQEALESNLGLLYHDMWSICRCVSHLLFVHYLLEDLFSFGGPRMTKFLENESLQNAWKPLKGKLKSRFRDGDLTDGYVSADVFQADTRFTSKLLCSWKCIPRLWWSWLPCTWAGWSSWLFSWQRGVIWKQIWNNISSKIRDMQVNSRNVCVTSNIYYWV